MNSDGLNNDINNINKPKNPGDELINNNTNVEQLNKPTKNKEKKKKVIKTTVKKIVKKKI